MEITKLSTKGQIVIPEEIRRGINVGTPFLIIKQDNLIILKKIEGLKKQEMEEIKELDKIWKEIDSGECESYSEEEFFIKLKEW
ncbi:MAG: AbrB/MazE/SpoVT family DNA-binding domain-containing protein [Candidatus Aureabacteria bacterium]|nr:AbrB/MazE/SpoVT family DNA-binding domain-containing protein [Candidatus Auribacterota bacterium]